MSSSPALPKPAPLLGTVTAIALAGFIPVIVLSSTPEPFSDAWRLAAVSTVLAGLMFSLVVSSKDRRPFEMTTWLFFYSFLGLAPLVQLRDSIDPETTRGLSHQFDQEALWVVIVSECALIVGALLGGRRGRASSNYPTLPDPMRTRIFSLVAIGISTGYVAIVGLSTLFDSRQARDLAIGNLITDDLQRTIIGAVVSMGLLVTTIAQRLLRSGSHDDRTVASGLLMAVSVTLLLVVVNPLGSPRYVFGTVALALLAAFGMFRTVQRFRALALSAIAGIVLLFPALDSFRYASATTIEAVDPLTALTTADFDGFAQIINTVEYVAIHGATLGNQLLGVLLFWVPRNWWPNKPSDTGILIAESKSYNFTNLSAPLPAELFINGGWVAVLIGMFLLGFWMRRWDLQTEATLSVFGVPSVLGAILPFYMILLMRGSLLQAMASLAVILVFTWLVKGRAGRRKKQEVIHGLAEPHTVRSAPSQ